MISFLQKFFFLNRCGGLILLVFFGGFMVYVFRISKKIEDLSKEIPRKQFGIIKSLFFIILGLFGLSFGASLTVENAVKLAKIFGVSDLLIGLTIVSAGTSLPELATSTVAAYKRSTDIVVGNIVGSNIFNILFILGLSAIIRPIPFELHNNIYISVTFISSLLLFLGMFTGKRHKLDRWQGILFLIIYIGYIAYCIIRG